MFNPQMLKHRAFGAYLNDYGGIPLSHLNGVCEVEINVCKVRVKQDPREYDGSDAFLATCAPKLSLTIIDSSFILFKYRTFY